MIDKYYFFFIVQFFILFIKNCQTIETLKFEREIGSTIVLPPCFSRESSSIHDVSTILFKSDSGELIIMNGKLISNNPRLRIKNGHSSELMIQSIELSDEGQYECRTDQTINYITHLIVINSSIIHLTVLEGSNITLQCPERSVWIIEESHPGGPVRTQYTPELVLTNVIRNDDRFQTIICSTRNGHEKRKYLIDIRYKPTVRLMMLAKQSLMCIICAHPLPYRIHWRLNTRKGRDENIHQTNINQSCIAQQFTFSRENDDDTEQIVTCEAENIHGIERASLQFNITSTTQNRLRTTKQSLFVPRRNILTIATTSRFIKNKSDTCFQTVSYPWIVFFFTIFALFSI